MRKSLLIENKISFTHNKQLSSKSLLRYPGGKTKAVNFISQFFPNNLTYLLSPFLGGGSVELHFAAQGTIVFGYDIFSPLVEFWQCLINNSNQLANKVAAYYPLPKIKFYELQEEQTKAPKKLERAAIYYVLNRSSFSGSTLSGGMSPNHPRFTTSAIQRIKAFNNPNIFVKKSDYKISLQNHPEIFAYLDPPYLIKHRLYGNKGDAHKNFDHEGLAHILQHRDKWILSYNDCAVIRTLYKKFRLISPTWKYGMSNDKTSKEVLIFSDDIDLRNFI
jgi:DNA adenine methylase